MEFNEIIEKVLEHEGGYVNDKDDLGGETKYGITKRFYPQRNILLRLLDSFQSQIITKRFTLSIL